MKVSLIQMNTQDNKAENLRMARELIEKAVAADGPDLVALPETFTSMSDNFDIQYGNAESIPDGEACRVLAGLAKKHGIYVHGGSMAERGDGRCYNTTVVFDPEGNVVGRYRKLHLFDVDVPGGVTYRESDSMRRGEEIVTCEAAGSTIGLSICYDLRFPELFRKLTLDQGAQVIVVPAAFTAHTGAAHWHTLLRARAIENQCWVLAAGQTGRHNEKRASYGHSLIIDPWGGIRAEIEEGEGVATAVIDHGFTEEKRTQLPCLRHQVLHRA